ncbi:hypothetical protein HAX54_048790, partial [Datura stramonium]|nr:hypothetical protein [Datura stramonium]
TKDGVYACLGMALAACLVETYYDLATSIDRTQWPRGLDAYETLYGPHDLNKWNLKWPTSGLNKWNSKWPRGP